MIDHTLLDDGFADFSNHQFDSLTDVDQQYVQDMGVMETVGVATAGILAAQSMLATAIAAPVYAGIMTAAAGGLVYSGYRKRKELPLVPSFGSTEAPTPGEVTNAAGTPVPVASI